MTEQRKSSLGISLKRQEAANKRNLDRYAKHLAGRGDKKPDPRDTELATLRADLAAALEREGRLREALEGMLAEWDKFTRYGSPMAKAANERVQIARAALAPAP